MTSYLDQSATRELIADRIAEAELRRLRRDLRRARVAARAAARPARGSGSSVDRANFPWARWIRLTPAR